MESLGWPKSSFGIFYSTLWKNSNELFGQHNTLVAEIFENHEGSVMTGEQSGLKQAKRKP